MNDGLIDLLGDIYMTTDVDGLPSIGWFCWAPVAYTPKAISVIRAVSNDPADANYCRYRIDKIAMGAIGKGDDLPLGARFPDKNLNLATDEDLFVVRGKVRPVVAFVNPTAKLLPVVKDGASPEKDLDNCLGCFPAYTLVDQYGNPRRKLAFVENVRSLKYAPFCFLPGHVTLRDRESFLRMDRLLWLPKDVLQPMALGLNGRGMAYVESWFYTFAGLRELDPELAALRDLLLEALDESRAKKEP